MTSDSNTTLKRAARPFFSPRRATGRFFIALAIGVITHESLRGSPLDWPVRAIAGWDAASLVLLALAWTIIVGADAVETERRAGGDDPGRHMVFAIALASSTISLFAATLVLRTGQAGPGTEVATVLMLAAVALSWVVTHTGYTLRYAHLYYRRDSGGEPAVGGLTFPGTDAPSDIDFAYFAFTLGMCFQVSDVAVTSTGMRREVLIHAIISFIYNTLILALALNVLFSLKP